MDLADLMSKGGDEERSPLNGSVEGVGSSARQLVKNAIALFNVLHTEQEYSVFKILR
jgi:hypothetical protein